MKKYILILFILAVLVLGYVWSQKNDIPEVNTGTPAGRKIEGNKDDLVYFSVSPGDTVSGTLNFKGIVKNAYFFEANIGINILDENKKLLKAGNAMATTDWMTSGPVSFEGSIDLTGLPTGPGYIQIANDNPSDRRDLDKFIFIPIIIRQSQASITESEILAQLNSDWQNLQARFSFRPGHPGTTAWLKPYAVQFISNDTLLISFEDGYNPNVAVLSYHPSDFQILNTFTNQANFTWAAWRGLVTKFGDTDFTPSTYTVDVFRNGEIVSFDELTKVPENVFLKNYYQSTSD